MVTHSALTPINNNIHLENWNATEPRPDWFTATGLDLSQKTEALTNRKYTVMTRMTFADWNHVVQYGASVLVRNLNDDDTFYIIGGKMLQVVFRLLPART